jgi:hypothetical protein
MMMSRGLAKKKAITKGEKYERTERKQGVDFS